MKRFTQNIILNTGRRAQISKRARKLSCNRWKKRKREEKEGKKSGLDLCPQEESCEGGKALHLGSPLLDREISLERGSFGALEESTAAGCGRQNGGWPAQMATTAAVCSPPWPSSTGVGGDWMLKLGLWRSDPGRGLGLAV